MYRLACVAGYSVVEKIHLYNLILLKNFREFNFRELRVSQKFFNLENFPNYGSKFHIVI